LVVAILSGCSESSTEKQLAAEKKYFASTGASVEMTSAEWLAGTLPDQFASRAVAAANDELAGSAGRAAQQMLQLKRDPQPLLDDMAAVLSSGVKVSAALEHSDHPAVDLGFKELQQTMATFSMSGAP
jgi:capsule polysaccharide export protein KpsE/RkpR